MSKKSDLKIQPQDIYTMVFDLEVATDRIAQVALNLNRRCRRLLGDEYRKSR